jgi:hypothetical protein
MEMTSDIRKLIKNRIVSAVQCGCKDLIVSKAGVSKKTLIEISRQEVGKSKCECK